MDIAYNFKGLIAGYFRAGWMHRRKLIASWGTLSRIIKWVKELRVSEHYGILHAKVVPVNMFYLD